MKEIVTKKISNLSLKLLFIVIIKKEQKEEKENR